MTHQRLFTVAASFELLILMLFAAACSRKPAQVAPGAPLLAIVPLGDLWVDANFKETQLRHVRIGQHVTLTADLYGGAITYRGTVIGRHRINAARDLQYVTQSGIGAALVLADRDQRADALPVQA